ncbi:HlyD family secretion protein [bacterium]|nr:HlyD family secretion protein [bacterium]
MRIVKALIPWLVAAALLFALWKWVLPLFKEEEKEMDIQTTSVVRTDLRQVVPCDGSVKPIVLVEVKSKASGVVQKINVEPGDMVEAGAVLVELDNKDILQRLRQAEAGLTTARAQLTLTKRNISPEQRASLESSIRSAELDFDKAVEEADRISEMHAKGYATDKELSDAQQSVKQAEERLTEARRQYDIQKAGAQPEEIEIAKASVERAEAEVANVKEELGYTTIKAPIAGKVLTRPVEIGTAVASGTSGNTGGTVVVTIGDLSQMYVKAMLEETDLGRVTVGMPCRISFDAYQNWVWAGTLTKIYPQGDDGSGGQGNNSGSSGTRFPVDITIDLQSGKMEMSRGDFGSMRGGGGGGGSGRMRRPGGGGRRGGGGGGRPGGGGGGQQAPAGDEPGKEGKPATPELLPNLTASVELVLQDHPDVLVLPAQYVKYDEEGKAYVEVLPKPDDQTVKERRDVELGFSDGLRYEIKSGVKEDETVILERPIKEEPRRF